MQQHYYLDNLDALNIIVGSMIYLIFYPINDRCILYLLCIDLLKIIVVPLVQFSLMKINNLKHFPSFEMRKKDSGHEQTRSRDATENPP